jgi:succinoglycan biosynthesis protein ExoM
MQSKRPEHISVCICTYRRPQLLRRLLIALLHQETDGLFEYSVAVVDNDCDFSARTTVDDLSGSYPVTVSYVIEPCQNIAKARNRVASLATGDYVALIDDDEQPGERWLLELYYALRRFAVDGVLAPVLPRYERPPPKWVLKGRFFERPAPATGQILKWTQTRSGNALLCRAVFERSPDWFDPAFGSGGEDRDFFKRKIAQGLVFAWTNEAAVHEWISPGRWDRGVLLRRALLRGKMALRSSDHVLLSVLRSALAVPAYGLALPFAALFGHHVVMQILLSTCDHLGKLLAALHVNPVRERYVQA